MEHRFATSSDAKLVQAQPTEQTECEFHPATRTMRSKSPYIVKNKDRKPYYAKSKYLETSIEKIHRILLTCQVKAEVARVLSPSCIWIRLFTHCLDKCNIYLHNQRYFLSQLVKYNDEKEMLHDSMPQLYNYYMAPRIVDNQNIDQEKDIFYARVRLLRIGKSENSKGLTRYKCFVFYIDYGDYCWIMMDSLAEMPQDLLNFPWQVTPVSLFGLSLVNENSQWSPQHCQILSKLISKHKQFDVTPIVSRNYGVWNYEDYSRVDLVGIQNDDDESDAENLEEVNKSSRFAQSESESIASQFYAECLMNGLPIKYERELEEATESHLYGVDLMQEISKAPRSKHIPVELQTFNSQFSYSIAEHEASDKGIKALKKKIADMRHEKKVRINVDEDEMEAQIEKLEKKLLDLKKENLNRWDPKLKGCGSYTVQVKQLSLNYLQKHGFFFNNDEKQMLISVIDLDECTISPYEFYGRLIPCSTSLKRAFKQLMRIDEEYRIWQKQLNVFYYLRENWKRLEFDHVTSDIDNQKRVYGIYALRDKHDEIQMCRVQVIGLCGGEHFWVRFLDLGGIRSINKRSLLRLNSIHTSRPPMAVQLCLSKLKTSDEKDWNKDQCELFRECTVLGSPMMCCLDEIKIYQEVKSTSRLNPNKPSYKERGDFFCISNLEGVCAKVESSVKTVENQMISEDNSLYLSP